MQPTLIPEQSKYSRRIRDEDLERKKNEHMNSVYSTHFIKFRPVPRIHRLAAKVLKCIKTEALNFRDATARLKVSLDNTQYKLVQSALQNIQIIDYILNKIPLLQECSSIDKHVMKILVGQLLWGHQSIPLGTIETSTIFYHEADIKELFTEADTNLRHTYISKLPIYIRVNTLSISLEQCINAFLKEGWHLVDCPQSYSYYLASVSQLQEKQFMRDIHISELLVFPPGTYFYNHPGFLRGKFLIQDKGSCLASFLLNPKPGSIVYDMCAGPGKTTNHIANIINNEGIVYATEDHPHRYNKLHSLLELTDVKCARTIHKDHLKAKIDNNVNYILIDAPSTYTGVFYKRQREGLGRRLKQYYHSSFKTLVFALQTFTTAKRIVFSSCTSFPEEGEKVVQYALQRVRESYNLLDVKELLWNEWSSFGTTESSNGSFLLATRCLRTDPNIDKCHGYFIAVFERNFDVPVPLFHWRSKDYSEFFDINEDDEICDDNGQPRKSSFPPRAKPKKKKYYLDKRFKKYKKNKKSKPKAPTPQTSTSANQIQNDCPGSRPFYELTDSQLYP